MRTRTPDGSDPPPALLLYARKLLGAVLDHAKATGLSVASRHVILPDGSEITAAWDGTTPTVTIVPAPGAAVPPVDYPTDLWVPRGFVVYPAWSDAPGGVGLPILPDSSAGPYTATNLDPGVDRARWTAGGPCGEVLISPDKNAGYRSIPNVLTTPLLFHPTRGPVFHWGGKDAYDARATSAWKTYRIALEAPYAVFPDESAANATAMFEAVNVARSDAGHGALLLPPRGYCHAAQVMCSIMQTAGSTDAESSSYPPTYTTTADRLTKDGFSATLMNTAFTSFNRGDNPTAYELRHLGGSLTEALAAWQADTDAASALALDTGTAGFLDVGFRGGYWAANVIQRTRWIGAGNAAWQSTDPALPPLSWHSFASVNLAWETYPAQFDADHYDTAPLATTRTFTTPDGDCWLNYPRVSAPHAYDVEPALSRYIYSRGRAIALAPRGGLVWCACATPIANADRLIALVHHPEDQPADSMQGYTRYLRVWWADIPRRAHLRLAPQETICGEDADDPWGWRGGQLIDLGSAPAPSTGWAATGAVTSLKYASCWRAAPDGLRAICLRDYGSYLDYGTLRDFPRQGWSAALNPRAVELQFTLTPTTVTTSVQWHDYTAGLTAAPRACEGNRPPDTTTVWDIGWDELGATPIAVDYTAAGAVRYAFSAQAASHQPVPYNPDTGTGFVAYATYMYVGTGDATTTYATDMAQRVVHGARFKSPESNAYFELAAVLDVREGAFALKLTRPRYSLDPTTSLTSVMQETLPCQVFSGAPVNGVRLCHDGSILAEDWYSAPDGAIWSTNDPCLTSLADVNSVNVYLPQAVSANIQGHFATRFGERVMGYQCAPNPGAAAILNSEPATADCDCWPTLTELGALHWMTYAEFAPRGGRAFSSVVLPPHDWLIYSKVV